MGIGDIMQANKEILNDELKEAINNLTLDDSEENAQKFVELLRKALFLVPIRKEDANEEQMKIMHLTNQMNEKYFQCYTDRSTYDEWGLRDESESIVLSFDEIAHIVLSNSDDVKGVVLNPFTENMIIESDSIKEIFTNDMSFIDYEKEPDLDVKQKMVDIFDENGRVDSAHLFCIKRNGEDGYLLVIDTRVKDVEEFVNKLGKTIEKTIKNINLDIMVTNEDVASQIIEERKPFYIASDKKE